MGEDECIPKTREADFMVDGCPTCRTKNNFEVERGVEKTRRHCLGCGNEFFVLHGLGEASSDIVELPTLIPGDITEPTRIRPPIIPDDDTDPSFHG